MNVAGLVLAAGGGSRLGRPKAEIEVGGRRLVDLAVEACVRAGLSPVVVVLGAVWLTPMPIADGSDRVDRADRADRADGINGSEADVRLVENAEWSSGMASSLRVGLEALIVDLGVDAVVVTLVDTPSVGAEHLRRIGSALRGGATAAVATYGGNARTPVGLTREVWADVAGTIAGDEGARGWLRAHPGLVTTVECADLGPWTDIDTAADLPD
jgi:CTP:molybdopterin cytidylyltransferase MocA